MQFKLEEVDSLSNKLARAGAEDNGLDPVSGQHWLALLYKLNRVATSPASQSTYAVRAAASRAVVKHGCA